jgi:hypothetical protein
MIRCGHRGWVVRMEMDQYQMPHSKAGLREAKLAGETSGLVMEILAEVVRGTLSFRVRMWGLRSGVGTLTRPFLCTSKVPTTHRMWPLDRQCALFPSHHWIRCFGVITRKSTGSGAFGNLPVAGMLLEVDGLEGHAVPRGP